MEYKNRIADQLLRDKLEAMGAVLIEGPKACGKTTTAEQQAKSIIYMDDPAKQQQYKQMAQTNISFLLEGETPRLIDEWQEVPQFWDAIRFEVDTIEAKMDNLCLQVLRCLLKLKIFIIQVLEDTDGLPCAL